MQEEQASWIMFFCPPFGGCDESLTILDAACVIIWDSQQASSKGHKTKLAFFVTTLSKSMMHGNLT